MSTHQGLYRACVHSFFHPSSFFEKPQPICTLIETDCDQYKKYPYFNHPIRIINTNTYHPSKIKSYSILIWHQGPRHLLTGLIVLEPEPITIMFPFESFVISGIPSGKQPPQRSNFSSKYMLQKEHCLTIGSAINTPWLSAFSLYE